MLIKGLRGDRQPLARQVFRAATQRQAIAADHPGDQPRQVVMPFAQRQVVAAFEQIDERVAQVHLQVDLRVLLKKTAHHLVEKSPTIGQRRGDFQTAAQAMLQLLDLLPRLVQPLQDLTRGFQVKPSGFRERNPPGTALEQTRPQLRLQVIDRFGQGRRGLAQLLGGATETAQLRGDHEHFQCTQLVHSFSIQAKTFFVSEAFCRRRQATNLAIRRNNKETFNEKIHPESTDGGHEFCLVGSHGGD